VFDKSFSALTLLIGGRNGIWPIKILHRQSQRFLFGKHLEKSAQPGVISVKSGLENAPVQTKPKVVVAVAAAGKPNLVIDS